MIKKLEVDQDEISLIHIYEFFRGGSILLAICVALGLLVGLVIAFVLPNKFDATALIESASVGKIARAGVEPPAVLAEKMKVPTYYSATTVQTCELKDFKDPSYELVKRLRPNVAKNSTYVAVSFTASSPDIAKKCLEGVLEDVVENQARMAKPMIDNLQVELTNAEQELQSNIMERDQQRIKNREKLNVAKSKLTAAENFVEKFSKDSLSFNFGDQQFSATALLLSTLIAKQNEIKDLEIQINALELEVAANMTDKDQAVRRMTNVVAELKNSLVPPNTKSATFAAPIYASDVSVEPKRGLIILFSLIAGGVFGILFLIGIRARNNINSY